MWLKVGSEVISEEESGGGSVVIMQEDVLPCMNRSFVRRGETQLGIENSIVILLSFEM